MKASLERRLGRALLAFGAALAVTYLLVVPQVAFKTEDAVLRSLAAAQLERLKVDEQALLPAPMFRLGDRADVPADLLHRLLALPEGVHELNDVLVDAGGAETDLFVAVVRPGDASAIVCHDVAELEAFDERLASPGYYAVILVGAAASLGLAAFGFATSRRVFASLGALGRLIATTDREKAQAMLQRFDDDEIGVLAQREIEARDALQRALHRERNFTRDASHELRTPVTIAAGALELLEREVDDDPRVRTLVERMRSAHRRIEELVVAFLSLARSEREIGERVREPVRRIVERVVHALEQQEGRGAMPFSIVEHAPLELAHVQPLGDVVLRNLLSNAVRHGRGDEVRVSIDDEGVTIENAELDAGAPSTRDNGFGQSIVSDLCQRFGWSVTFERRAGRYAVRLATGVHAGWDQAEHP